MGRSDALLRWMLISLLLPLWASACVERNGGGNEQDIQGDYATCIPLCDSKECGDDGCGGTCGNCPGAAPICTDSGLCVATCAPSCNGKECGPDGCGSQCGNCPQAAPFCDAQGMCQATCNANCAGRECGDDGCGGSCGSCPAVAPVCSAMGACQLQCNSNCGGRVCGDDGCGGSCGSCTEPTPFCTEAGACVGACTGDCTGKQCGDDGCGVSCGDCSQGLVCSGTQCVSELCQGMDCGAHGTCATPYGYPLCQCEPGYYDIGSGCQSGVASNAVVAEMTMDCTGPQGGLFTPIGTKTIRAMMLYNYGATQETTCTGMPPFYTEVKCLALSGTIVTIALDGVDIQTENLFDSLIGTQFRLDFVDNGTSVQLDVENIVPQPEPATGFTGFQLASMGTVPLTSSNGYPQWTVPLEFQGGLTLFYYPPNWTVPDACFGQGTIRFQ